jgi:hypothetical protein
MRAGKTTLFLLGSYFLAPPVQASPRAGRNRRYEQGIRGQPKAKVTNGWTHRSAANVESTLWRIETKSFIFPDEWATKFCECFFFKYFLGDFFFFCSYNIQHCFICRPSDSTVPTDAGIEPRTVATCALAVRRSNH